MGNETKYCWHYGHFYHKFFWKFAYYTTMLTHYTKHKQISYTEGKPKPVSFHSDFNSTFQTD